MVYVSLAVLLGGFVLLAYAGYRGILVEPQPSASATKASTTHPPLKNLSTIPSRLLARSARPPSLAQLRSVRELVK